MGKGGRPKGSTKLRNLSWYGNIHVRHGQRGAIMRGLETHKTQVSAKVQAERWREAGRLVETVKVSGGYRNYVGDRKHKRKRK